MFQNPPQSDVGCCTWARVDPIGICGYIGCICAYCCYRGRPEDTPIKYLPFAGLKGTADKAAAAVSAEQPTVDVLIAELATGFKFAATSMPATRPAAAVAEAELAAAVTEAELAAVPM